MQEIENITINGEEAELKQYVKRKEFLEEQKKVKGIEEGLTKLNGNKVNIVVNKTYIHTKSSKDIELELDHVYLLSIQNSYNVGGVYIIQTGSESAYPPDVITICNTTYFIVEMKNKATIEIQSKEATGYVTIVQIA